MHLDVCILIAFLVTSSQVALGCVCELDSAPFSMSCPYTTFSHFAECVCALSIVQSLGILTLLTDFCFIYLKDRDRQSEIFILWFHSSNVCDI